jgi:hypothetical protein
MYIHIIMRISSFDGSGDLSMSVGNNIIDASRDLIISVGHNITYLSIISYTVYNCPNTVNHIKWDNPDNICYPDFRLNLAIWLVDIVLINFSAIFYSVNSNYLPYTVDFILILGQWIDHAFESIQPCISSFSFRLDMEFVMVLSQYFTSDSIFFPY